MKKVLSISEQLSYLEENKKIFFKNNAEKKRAEIFFTRYNYLNVISLKYLFATGKIQVKQDDGSYKFHHLYKYETKYSTLEKKYNELLKFENKLRDAVLGYETELKVHLVLFLKELLTRDNIDFRSFLNRLQKFNRKTREFERVDSKFNLTLDDEWKKQVKEYSSSHVDWNDYYYLLLKILSFGTINRFLSYEYPRNTTIYTLFKIYLKNKGFSIGNKINDLETIGILRNSLCHKESLITFLDKGYRKDKIVGEYLRSQGKTLNRSFMVERINATDIIYQYHKLKASKKIKQLDNNSWIKRFSKNRLNNGKFEYFKKMRINL